MQLSVAEFARKLEIVDNNIYNYEGDRTKPNTDFLENLKNQFPDLNLNWLVCGEGKMNLSEEDNLTADVSGEFEELKKIVYKDRQMIEWLEKEVNRMRNGDWAEKGRKSAKFHSKVSEIILTTEQVFE